MEWKESCILADDDEMAYGSDSKFKQFGTAVDKTLKSFEYSTEWADLISCLGKLNKVISTYSTFHVIPRKLLVGKRLAQCLHPALPSGVHLKALETYKLIFKQIGKPRLTKDLFIYSAGLFPLLAAAAISVKPVLLDLYEQFYVPLGPHLIPGLPGFIMAVLPGIEEGSDFNERTTSLLEAVCQNSQRESFFSSLWGCILHATNIRLPAITFALCHLTKDSDDNVDKRYIYGNDLNLMVDAICSALEDKNVLVQRIMLDFLLSFVPLENEQLNVADVVNILVCSLNVVLRRDMSLNRRLFQWILGSANESHNEDTSRKSSFGSNPVNFESASSHFETNTKKYVVAAIVVLFRSISKFDLSPLHMTSSGAKMDKLKPFRILISLLDKPEIGSAVLEDVLIEVFSALYQECGTVFKANEGPKGQRYVKDELIKTANLLFNAFESYFIWEYLERALINSFQSEQDSNLIQNAENENIFQRLMMEPSKPDCSEVFKLIDFLLDVVAVEVTIETQTDHWPSLLNCILKQVTNNSNLMKTEVIYQGVLLASKLLSRISPDMKSPIISRKKGSTETHQFIGKISKNNTEQNKGPKMGNEKVDNMKICVENSTKFFHAFVNQRILGCQRQKLEESEELDMDDGLKHERVFALTFAASCRYLVEIACFPCWKPFTIEKHTNENKMTDWLHALITCVSEKNINIQTVAMGTLLDLINVSLCVFPPCDRNQPMENSANVMPLISHADFVILDQSQIYKEMALILWNEIHPDNCQVHSVCANLFLRLHNISPNALLCEDVVSNTMVAQSLEIRRSSHWKFSVLWHLSRDFYKNESSKSSRGGNRSLDRCMMLMLDSLQSDDPVINKCSKEWLQHAVHCGDIGRLIEPLLITMLNPSSRRISVHYASLWETITREDEADTVSQDILSDSENDQVYQGSDALEDDVSSDYSIVKRSNNESDSSHEIKNDLEVANDPEIEKIKQNGKEDGLKPDPLTDGNQESTVSMRTTFETTRCKNDTKNQRKSVHPLHVHKLFYTQLYDTTQTIYALKTIYSMLNADGKILVFSSATTSMNMCNTAHQIGLRELLIRHRRALIGKDFYGSLADSQQLLIKASTAKYMEILLSICLYFIRSEYHPCINGTDTDLEDNFRVRVWSLHVLTKVIGVLLELVAEGDVAFANFVADLFDRCKVQRIALHCLLSSVYSLSLEIEQKQERSFTVEERNLASDSHGDVGRRSEVQRHCLEFIKKLIFLEERINYGKAGNIDKKMKKLSQGRKSKLQQKSSQFEFIIGLPIVCQPMFLSVLLSALKEERWNHNHDDWIKTVMEILPKTGTSLPKLVIPVVDQIFLTLKDTTVLYYKAISGNMQTRNERLPIDYLLKMLENVTKICHHCLIEKENVCGSIKSSNDIQHSETSSSIFDSLVHVFSSQATPNRSAANEEVNEPWMEAKEGLLSILPAVLSSVLMTWHIWSQTRVNRFDMVTESPLPIGQPKRVHQAILQLLTPLAMQHTPVFLAAVADVWNSSKQIHAEIESEILANDNEKSSIEGNSWLEGMNQKTLPIITSLQKSLLEIITSIKVLSIEKIIDSSKNILRQTLVGKERNSSGNQSLELNLLQFVFEYLQKISNDQLLSIKPILMCFLKDGISFNGSPQTLFVLLNIFYSYVSHTQCPDDKRSRKELQDLAIKFFEAMNSIAGASLENSTWFRRNVAVLPKCDQSEDEDNHVTSRPTTVSTPTTSLQIRNSQFSANAHCLMAEVLSSMLDLLYTSEEKDRITSFLFYIMYNITPYLKNHSVQNTTSFRASSALLASITDYQYTLRSWKKDVYELFLENEFFKMDLISLRFWRCIIDHLMTYDNTTFKDLMARINMTQSGAINIFANREQEIEQRASLLKRLSFVIFCGENDQYHNYMPDIQERLVDSLRQLQAPLLHQQVFFCFRILILRMSPHHLTSLWPHLITELVTVFLRIEKELISTDSHQSKNSIMGTIESFFTLNGLTKSKEKWLLLYLEACKLLDLSFTLDTDDVPHFQSYRWAFVDTPGVEYDHLENVSLNYAAPEKLTDCKGHVNGEKSKNQEKLQDRAVSKLSVMNAPLSSKLRKNDKRGLKEKFKTDGKSKHGFQTKFAPYLSRLTVLLSHKCTDTSKKYVADSKQIDLIERKNAAKQFVDNVDINQMHQDSDPTKKISHSAGNNLSSEEDDSCSTVSKVTCHPLHLLKIGSIFDLLHFFESVCGMKETGKGRIQKMELAKLEELTEKDFQEELCGKSK